VKDRETREPLTPQRQETRSPEMAEVVQAVFARKARPAFRWNLVILAPPLTLSDEEMDEGLAAIEAGLEVADRHTTAARV
jgi:taurine--2-oxoglutarate transaminase